MGDFAKGADLRCPDKHFKDEFLVWDPEDRFQVGRNKPLQAQQIPSKLAVEHAPSPRPGANPGGLNLIRQMRAAA